MLDPLRASTSPGSSVHAFQGQSLSPRSGSFRYSRGRAVSVAHAWSGHPVASTLPGGSVHAVQRAVTVTAVSCSGSFRHSLGGVAIHSPGLSSRPRGGWRRTQQGSRKAREAYFHAFLSTNRLTPRAGPAVTAGEVSGTHRNPLSAFPQWVCFKWPPAILCPGFHPRRVADV